ncbi:phage tail protein [Actinocatenispora thailandica]|nr:phage tail protein [Actinocatenispora thailandica]
MRFAVKLDNTHLGEWQSCSGLSVNFNPQAVRTGGDHLHQYYLTGQLEYGTITLARAMNGRSSPRLQAWLHEVTSGWSAGVMDEDRTATVTLLDADRKIVARWELRGVVPVAWTGPDLAAGTNAVAIEKLQLRHQGFLGGMLGGSAGSSTAGPGRSVITLSDQRTEQRVEFRYNAESISVSRSTQRSENKDASGAKVQVEANQTTYSVNNLRLVGPDTEMYVERLLAFATPRAQESEPGASMNPQVFRPPQLSFRWGAFDHLVVIDKLGTTYDRFDGSGRPVRATVSLTLKEQSPADAATPPDAGPPAVEQSAVAGAAAADTTATDPGDDESAATPEASAASPAADEGGDAEDRRPQPGQDVRTGLAQRPGGRL